MRLKIPAGPALNALVAEKVMGWIDLEELIKAEGDSRDGWIGIPPGFEGISRLGGAPFQDVPDYSHDWNLINPIAEKLRAEHFTLKMTVSMDHCGATFLADWYTGAISGLFFTSYADDLAHAVCLAALQAKGYKP